MALSIKGPKITRVAVFNFAGGMNPVPAWYPFELREPVDEAMPIPAPGAALYVLGRRIYAFASAAKRWDVLEFPEGTKPTPLLGSGSVRFENTGHIYTFNTMLGKWNDLDLRAILNAPEKTGEAKPKPENSQ